TQCSTGSVSVPSGSAGSTPGCWGSACQFRCGSDRGRRIVLSAPWPSLDVALCPEVLGDLPDQPDRGHGHTEFAPTNSVFHCVCLLSQRLKEAPADSGVTRSLSGIRDRRTYWRR